MSDERIYYGLSIVTALVLSAIFSMNFFHEGTSMGKYYAKKSELDRVKEAEVTHYSDMVLYGDEVETVPLDIDLSEKSGSAAGFLQTEKIMTLDKYMTLGLMLLAWLMLIPWFRKRRWLAHLYLLMGVYLILLSFYKGANGGAMFSELSIPAHATRWLPCMVIWIWLIWKPRRKTGPTKPLNLLLLFACSLTFATHGYEALMLNPHFSDLLYGVFECFSIPLSEQVSEVLLRLIGIMDIALACLVIFFRRKVLFLWMAVWGALTALSRPMAFGHILWEDSLLRIGNCLVPLAVLMLILLREKSNRHDKTKISS